MSCITQHQVHSSYTQLQAVVADMADLIEDAVVKVHPHGLLLAQVDFKNIQLAAVEAVGSLL